MTFKKPLLFSLLLTTCSVFSQDVLWKKSLGGKQAEFLYDLQPTTDLDWQKSYDGNERFLLDGSSNSNTKGNNQFRTALQDEEYHYRTQN